MDWPFFSKSAGKMMMKTLYIHKVGTISPDTLDLVIMRIDISD